MDFTSNLRVASNANKVSNFQNQNSCFKVSIPPSYIFQLESSELPICSITCLNQFKVLPSYLNSGLIKCFYMYSNVSFLWGSMEINSTVEEPSSLKNVSSDMSLDPYIVIKNLNKKCKNEKIEWKYDDQQHRISILTDNDAYVLKIPYYLGIMLGFQDGAVNYNNPMVFNHTFKNSWFYKVFCTPKFIDVMKKENDLSIYELLNDNNFPVEGYFYLAMSHNDTYQIENQVNLGIHHPRYALLYNNVIKDSIVDNGYYKVLKSVYFEDSDSRWKAISYKNDEYKKIQEKIYFT